MHVFNGDERENSVGAGRVRVGGLGGCLPHVDNIPLALCRPFDGEAGEVLEHQVSALPTQADRLAQLHSCRDGRIDGGLASIRVICGDDRVHTCLADGGCRSEVRLRGAVHPVNGRR